MSLALGLSRIQDDAASEWLTPSDVLAMATTSGAQALGRTGEIGTIAPGAYADLVFVRKDSPRFLGSSDSLRMFLLGGCADDIDKVMVGGRFVLDDGALVTFDERQALDEAKRLADGLQERNSELLRYAADQAGTLQAMSEGAFATLGLSPAELADTDA
jgi:cytosine/adenosine deaminase-related metal-dependent hydrolase